MIENIRKNPKLSKLLNLFHIALLCSLVILLINFIGGFNAKDFARKIIGPLPLFFAVVGFNSISMCIIAYLGNLKQIYNGIWFGKISMLVVIVVTAVLLSQSIVNKEAINSFALLYTMISVMCSAYLIQRIDEK